MSEHLFRFLLTELKIIRVRCAHCGAVAELPIGELYKALAPDGRCRFCNLPIVAHDIAGSGTDPLLRLVQVTKELAAMEDRIEFEFSLPAKPADAQ